MADRNAADITRGSIWPARGAGHARVIAVAGGHVRFARESGAIEVLHHLRFREVYREPYDARQCRSQFSMSVANLVSFHAFWSPSLRRMFARSSTIRPSDCARASRGRPALPPDAVLVGTYVAPVSPDTFFADLNDVLADAFRRPSAA